MKPSVYIETSVVSYLTARASRDALAAEFQRTTRLWWDTRAANFTLVVSETVVWESAAGDPRAGARRLEILRGLTTISVPNAAGTLAKRLIAELRLPPKAGLDALPIASAATYGTDYLLTWNCTHIANAAFRPRIESVCRASGVKPPIICTPAELM